MTTAQFLIIATILLYLMGMLAVGFYFSKKGGSGSSDEFTVISGMLSHWLQP